ncbi:MAG: hypothetical protein WCP18_00130 [bacterium]
MEFFDSFNNDRQAVDVIEDIVDKAKEGVITPREASRLILQKGYLAEPPRLALILSYNRITDFCPN